MLFKSQNNYKISMVFNSYVLPKITAYAYV